MNQVEASRIFKLNVTFKEPLQDKLFSLVRKPIEHFLAFPRMNRAYADIARMTDSRPFPDKVLGKLNVVYDLTDEDLSRIMIPNGPVIIVSNHPFGGIEGLILASLLRSLRCDVKFMANYLLNSIPEMREMLIPVNPFKGKTSVRDNIKPLRESMQWVKNGGMLVVFPAGEVSHFDLQKGVVDPAWSPTVARLIRKTGAPVLPVFFQGTNSAAFHMAGMLHPLLRTAMLPNELFNKNRKTIQVHAGDLIPFEKLTVFAGQDEAMTDYLRLRTYVLSFRDSRVPPSGFSAFIQKTKQKINEEVLPPRNPDVMAEEIRGLRPTHVLVENNEHIVVCATAGQIPHILLEIGRLREATFRVVGEGTGRAADLDRFDRSYIHLFIWNREKNEVVGAYRLGKTDEIMMQRGARGLYTNTLFRYKPGFFEHLGPALELGRSFVRLEYQKSYAPLLLLWKGIGRFIVDNPQYKTLFGPVSITDEYHAVSKQLMVSYLTMTKYRNDLAEFVKARKPLHPKPLKGWDVDAAVRLLKDDVESISELIACVESDRKGIPILLKQYLKLGGELAGFNVDPAFGNVLDGLIIVDLTKTEPRILERYLGRDGTRQFWGYHDSLNRERHAVCA
ncbi:MAG TPA: GNAT family N-acyltransferase [Nitrospirota bacterium]